MEPVTERPDLKYSLPNCRPAHGSPGNACPVCSKAAGRPINCNGIRGAMSVERARRIIAERTGITEPPRKPKPEGREFLPAQRAPARYRVRPGWWFVFRGGLQIEVAGLPRALLAGLMLVPDAVIAAEERGGLEVVVVP